MPHDPHRHPQSQSPDLTSQQTEEVEAKLANIVRKYESRLSEEQRTHLRHILSYNEKMLASVRLFPLQNGDPPASVLKISFQNEAPHEGTPHAALGPAGASDEREEGNR